MPLVRPKAALFDWDNTLVDSLIPIHRALEGTFREMGQQPWTLEEARRRVGRSLRETFPILFGDRWEEATEIFYRNFGRDHLGELRPMPGAQDLLDALSDIGVFVAIVSNKNGDFLRQEVTHLGWAGYFRQIVGANDASRDKPAMEPVILALTGSGVDPGVNVWFVGDNALDVDCAHASGCTAIILRGELDEAEESIGQAWRFDDCRALAKLVRQP